MMVCDLCGAARECRPREIEAREYDICAECWSALAEKLKGKGRTPRQRETVVLPPPAIPEREPEKPPPRPERPPKIWGRACL